VSARPPPRTSAPPPRPPADSAPTLLREGPSARPPPGATTTAPSLAIFQKVTRNALLALAAFSALTALGLAAWFASSDDPWGFASVIAIGSLLGALATAALLWRRPRRNNAYAALGVMGFSILRVGAPTHWTWASVALITFTAVLAIPVVQAAMVLPRS